jgi:hypothetical protein
MPTNVHVENETNRRNRQVLPPPIIKPLTLSKRFSINCILSVTLAPPRIHEYSIFKRMISIYETTYREWLEMVVQDFLGHVRNSPILFSSDSRQHVVRVEHQQSNYALDERRRMHR